MDRVLGRLWRVIDDQGNLIAIVEDRQLAVAMLRHTSASAVKPLVDSERFRNERRCMQQALVRGPSVGRTANQQHLCWRCGSTIQNGEPYRQLGHGSNVVRLCLGCYDETQ